MLINTRWLLLFLLLSTCLLVTDGKGGRGGSRGGSRGRNTNRGTSSRRRPTYRPAARPSPRPAYKPSPLPAPKPTIKATPRPQPPSPRPAYPATPKASAPQESVVVKQPASNPNFKETNPAQGAANKQPAYNPNYKPDGGAPGGPPPPYSPAGHPAPNAPAGPPPPYQPNAPGQRLPYPQQPGVQPPPYPGLPGRPPAYPGQSAPYPQQPGYPGGSYPRQPGYPGGYPQQPGYPGSYPRQPGYPGGYPQQPGYPGSYPRQPGYPGGYPQYPGGSRPYPQQPLGGNVWRPQSGMPAPAYMNYGGIPTGTNMYSKPHKQKGFLGSLMSMGSHKQYKPKKNKYYGSYPSPYGVGGFGGGGFGAGHRGGGFLGKYGKSAAMYTILPYMAYKTVPKLFRPRFMFLPLFLPTPHFHHYNYAHYGHRMYPGYVHYYDVYSDDYVGKCQRPLKKEHTDIRCRATYDDIKCDAKCEDGYEFPNNITLISNRCWHVTGVWKPNKNFPACTPICYDECMNGGECIRPDVCKCPAEFRGDRCQFRKLNFLACDVRKLTKNERNVGWVCNHFKNETECNVRCKAPAEFESPAAEVYKCAPTGEWTPDSLPHCIVKENKTADSGAA